MHELARINPTSMYSGANINCAYNHKKKTHSRVCFSTCHYDFLLRGLRGEAPNRRHLSYTSSACIHSGRCGITNTPISSGYCHGAVVVVELVVVTERIQLYLNKRASHQSFKFRTISATPVLT